MSVVYLPQDQRWSGIGQGLGSLMGAAISGYVERQRQQKILDAMKTNPEIPTQDLFALAGGDPHMTELVSNMVKGRAADAALKKADVETKLATAHTDEAHARTHLVELETEQVPQKEALTALEIKLKAAELEGEPAKIQLIKAQRDEALQKVSESQENINFMKSLRTQFATETSTPTPTAEGTEGTTAQPTSYTELRSKIYSSTDPYFKKFDDTISKAEAYLKTPFGQGFNPPKGVGTVARGPAVTERETSYLTSVQNLTQILGDMKSSIVVDKTGKLKFNPVNGTIQDIFNAYSNNPNDPNVLFQTLASHAGIATGSLIQNSRMGFQIVSLLKGVVAKETKSLAQNLVAIDQSVKMLDNTAHNELGRELNTHAIGINLDLFKDIHSTAKRVYDIDPTLHGGKLDRSGTAQGTKDTAGLPQKLHYTEDDGSTREINTEDAIKLIMDENKWDRAKAVDALKKKFAPE